MKTPDEIKKALRICSNSGIWDCDACPYGDSDDGWECRRDLYECAAAYIQQLELERNAAVQAVHGVCSACIHFDTRYEPGDTMSCCKFEECIHGADDFDSEDYWQWRGVKEGKQ